MRLTDKSIEAIVKNERNKPKKNQKCDAEKVDYWFTKKDFLLIRTAKYKSKMQGVL